MEELTRPEDTSAYTEEQDTTVEKLSGRLKTQNAVISSELFWYGKLQNSDDVHESALRSSEVSDDL